MGSRGERRGGWKSLWRWLAARGRKAFRALVRAAGATFRKARKIAAATQAAGRAHQRRMANSPSYRTAVVACAAAASEVLVVALSGPAAGLAAALLMVYVAAYDGAAVETNAAR